MDDFRAGLTNITHEDNVCGRADTVGMTSNYLGENSIGVNINSQGDCTTRDQHNQVGFGVVPGAIAVTCNWIFPGMPPQRIESDVRYSTSVTWTTGNCAGMFANAYYIEGLTTHERGHTFNVPDLTDIRT